MEVEGVVFTFHFVSVTFSPEIQIVFSLSQLLLLSHTLGRS